MIDTIYKTLLTIINKENQGYLSPTEFNLIAYQVQHEIYRGYFEDYNRDKNKDNRGLTNSGYGNLPDQDSQRIEIFSAVANLTGTNGVFTLPSDVYLLEDEGICTTEGKIVDKVSQKDIRRLQCSEAHPTETYPVYTQAGDTITVSPDTITDLEVGYLREPLVPKWTYVVINGKELYDPTNPSFQDFELHPSEFSNIIHRMLSYFGINLRESEVIQYAESLKQQKEIHDES